MKEAARVGGDGPVEHERTGLEQGFQTGTMGGPGQHGWETPWEPGPARP